MGTDGFLTIGKITGILGTKGEVAILSYAESPDILTAGMDIRVKLPDGQDKTMKIQSVKSHKKGLRILFEGIEDRGQADDLKGADILIDRRMLPELEEGTYYWTDLIGLSVYTTANDYLGRLETIIPTGSNDVYVVKHQHQETLIPALESVVIAVNLEERTMRVDLLPGL